MFARPRPVAKYESVPKKTDISLEAPLQETRIRRICRGRNPTSRKCVTLSPQDLARPPLTRLAALQKRKTRTKNCGFVQLLRFLHRRGGNYGVMIINAFLFSATPCRPFRRQAYRAPTAQVTICDAYDSAERVVSSRKMVRFDGAVATS